MATLTGYRAAHVVLEDHLYVIGGETDENSYANLVECYDPSTDKWQTVAPMLNNRHLASACASNGFIYVFGGECYDGLLQSIEKYDPILIPLNGTRFLIATDFFSQFLV